MRQCQQSPLQNTAHLASAVISFLLLHLKHTQFPAVRESSIFLSLLSSFLSVSLTLGRVRHGSCCTLPNRVYSSCTSRQCCASVVGENWSKRRRREDAPGKWSEHWGIGHTAQHTTTGNEDGNEDEEEKCLPVCWEEKRILLMRWWWWWRCWQLIWESLTSWILSRCRIEKDESWTMNRESSHFSVQKH